MCITYNMSHKNHTLQNTTPKINDNNLNIFYLNIKSVQNKLDEIKTIMQQSNLNRGMVNRKWHRVRKSSVETGITICVINSLQSNISFEYSDNFNNFIIVYLRKFKINIIVAYNTHNETFLEKIEKILSANKSGIFLGDVNIDLLKNNKTLHTADDIAIIYASTYWEPKCKLKA